VSTLIRRATASAIAATAVIALSACGTSFSAQTNQQYQAAEGTNQRGEVDSMNTVLVADDAGTAVVSAGLVNQTDTAQTLTDVTITTADGTTLDVTPPAGDVTIQPGKIVTLGSDSANLFGVAADAVAGRYVTITFEFSDAEDTRVDAPTVARNHTYESVVPYSAPVSAEEAAETAS